MEHKNVDYKASLPIQIRFSDIDALGHINNNIYLSFFDLGKGNYFKRVRGNEISWMEGAIVIAHLEMDYLAPVFYTEPVEVQSKVVRIGDKSAEFVQQILNVKTNEVKCICKSTFVYFDAEKQIPVSIPHAWREAISKYEGVKL